MQIGREAILRRWDGIEQHECADLSAMTYAVGDHMHEHLLAGHTARGAVARSSRASGFATFERRLAKWAKGLALVSPVELLA